MFYLKFLFAALAIFKIVSSLPVDEKIQPVDLAYNCINVEKDEESKTKSPVLLMHGLGESRKAWNNLILLLASRTKREVCAVDLRNHGDSPWNNRTDVEALATDLGHFLDKRGMKKVNLIGHSLGGKTAVHFSLKNSDRVDSIVTEDINPNTLSKNPVRQIANSLEIMNAALQSIPEGTSQEDAKKSIVNFINKKFEEEKIDLGNRNKLEIARQAWQMRGSSKRMPESFSESFELKLTDGRWHFKFNIVLLIEFVKNIERFWTVSSGLYEGPALFIYGTKSPFKVNEDKENILKLFPKAELFPVEGAGHNIQGIFPEFDDAVIRFLNKVN